MLHRRFAIALIGTFLSASVTPAAELSIDDALFDRLDPARPSDRAIIEAHSVIEADPENLQAHIRLGNALRSAGLPEEATAAFDAATRIDPGSTVAWNNLGVMYQMAGNPNASTRAFRRAIEANPRNGEARYNLAHVLAERGQFERAVSTLEGALLASPELADAWANPRVYQSRMMLPARLALYRGSVASKTLPTMGADGEPSLLTAIDAPWLGRTGYEYAILEQDAQQQASAQRAANRKSANEGAVPTDPGTQPTPIEIGPADVPDAPEASPKTDTRKIGGRTIRSGGPMPGKR